MMLFRSMVIGALLIASCMAATSSDNAVIVNSGSTNAMGYKIVVLPDGSGSLTPQNRTGAPSGASKAFNVPPATAKRFFANLAAAKTANLSAAACMKSASFGTTTHVTWQGWTSPDLDCPPSGEVGTALTKDIEEIQRVSGAATMPVQHP